MSELILSDDNFEAEVLQSSVPVLVDFWASWCGPCQKMLPIVEELSQEMDASKVKIAKMNVEENQMTTGKYEVMSIPTFILFKGGEAVARTEGGQSKEVLQSFIESSL
ncbi:MAG: thioredoxin [Candidatus Magasanikbacteria bacterium CG11_big_fil_rev_8_21_14_0_20_39_34]|uniref:Thioredoxin n=1 Tax=Candidatus Magasanikbacteria bacterium CG11_big_fil_rev_8_21_14_0_20_39_34 TaxID=1974653 RepID=A0A2H0N4W5_9BACT|nr:MAG: thioredoxin [Candidatus Magasanikbacteria bacterium CG11_big_fil_rev_8_21_14_0_20_39_34]